MLYERHFVGDAFWCQQNHQVPARPGKPRNLRWRLPPGVCVCQHITLRAALEGSVIISIHHTRGKLRHREATIGSESDGS